MPLPQEQKLALQSRSKDTHLNQLGEVEKRFSALSRQCAMVKQGHEKLEQNGNEWMDRWIHAQSDRYMDALPLLEAVGLQVTPCSKDTSALTMCYIDQDTYSMRY